MVEAPQRVPYGKPGPVDRWLRANLANSSIRGPGRVAVLGSFGALRTGL
jgi:hypothetical protein